MSESVLKLNPPHLAVIKEAFKCFRAKLYAQECKDDPHQFLLTYELMDEVEKLIEEAEG